MKRRYYFGAMFVQVHNLCNYLFPGTSFIDSRFTDFNEVLMKDLARMLIYVCKKKNCRVSFKMLLSMCLVLLRRYFEHSCDHVTFRMPFSKKTTITVTEVVLIQVSFLTVGSKQK